jgi:hypothetical protein
MLRRLVHPFQANAKRLLVHMGDRRNSALPTAGLAVQCRVLLYQSRDRSRAQIQLTGNATDRDTAPPQTFELGHHPQVMLGTWAPPTRPWALARCSPAIFLSLKRAHSWRSTAWQDTDHCFFKDSR